MYSVLIKKEKIILRGYLKYKKNKNINIFNKIKNEIIDKNLNLSKKSILKNYFKDPEKSIKQYLINDLLISQSNSFRLRLYYSNIKHNFYFPLPNEWKKILTDNDVKYNNLLINYLWFFYILKKSLFGLSKALIILFFTKKNICFNNDFVIIDEIYKNSLPIEQGKNTVFNFLDQNENRFIGVKYNSFYGNKKFFHFDIFQNLNLNEKLNIFFKFLKFFLLSFFNRNYYDLILSLEILKLFIVDKIENTSCPKKIYALSTNYLYKPLWVQRLEDKFLIENIMLFYSTNYIDENLKNSEQLKMLTWKNLLTFDPIFKKKLINYNSKFNINICGKFTLYDKDIFFSNNDNKRTIAIFDHFCFSNINYLKYCNVGVDREILRPKIIIKFLKHTIDLALNNNFQVYYKTKIHANKFMSKDYIKLIDNYKKDKNFKNVNVYSSALTLINKIDKVISMPLSTINFFLKDHNKDFLIYYPDIKKENYFSNCDEICFDKSNLEKFIKK